MTRDQIGADRPVSAVFDEELRADALDVLRVTLERQLTEAHWSEIKKALCTLAKALRSDDVDGFERAVNYLDSGVDGTRATGVGDPPTVPAPEHVRDEINILIHTLDDRADTQE